MTCDCQQMHLNTYCTRTAHLTCNLVYIKKYFVSLISLLLSIYAVAFKIHITMCFTRVKF